MNGPKNNSNPAIIKTGGTVRGAQAYGQRRQPSSLCQWGGSLCTCAWSTIYELAQLEGKVIDAAVADGKIFPKMQRKDAVELRKLNSEGAPKSIGAKTAKGAGTSAKPNAEPKKSDVVVPDTAADILEPWLRASPAVHQHAVDGIGVKDWFGAVPKEWYPLIEQLLAAQRQPVIDSVPAEPVQASDDDDSIPRFLWRECSESDAQVAAADSDAADEAEENRHDREDSAQAPTHDDAAEEPGDYEEDEDEDEPEFKPKRKLKLVEYEGTLADAISRAFADLSDLATECREVVDNASELSQQTNRIQTLEQSADELESLEAPDIADALSATPIKYELPKRRYVSRAAHAADAATILGACVRALDANVNEVDRAAAQELISDLENVIGTVDNCEFPGAYG
jgi:hypothetical protein